MNHMYIFLLATMLPLSQQTFTMFSLTGAAAYEKQDDNEIFRGHPDWLKKSKQEKKNKTLPTKPVVQTSSLKGSSDKVNDNK